MKMYIENKEYNVYNYNDYQWAWDDSSNYDVDFSEPMRLSLIFGFRDIESSSLIDIPIDELIRNICAAYGIDKELICETNFYKDIHDDYENDVMFAIRNMAI